MRKVISAILVICVLILGPLPAGAVSVPRNGPGIANEQEYREVLFITGKPIPVSGTVRVTESNRDGVTQIRLTCRLENTDQEVIVSRSVTFVTREEEKLNQRQTVSVTTVDRFNESIKVGDNRYRLVDFRFHKSTLTDKRPAVDYFTGNWTSRKTYEVGRGEGTVTVESQGETVGYVNPWSSTETQRIDSTIVFDGDITVGDVVYPTLWTGTVSYDLSFNRQKNLIYLQNEPTQISFEGGYLQSEGQESAIQYNYNLPRLDDNGLVLSGRNLGYDGDRIATVPVQVRLPVPFLRDIKGHWARYDILKLYGLEIFEGEGEYFGPRLPMTRAEFAKALVLATDMLPKAEKTAIDFFDIFTPPEEEVQEEQSPFADVPVDHPYYDYIKAVHENGVIRGTGYNLFSPAGKLTRAQAITIIIRALGLEGLAPVGRYGTGYRDEDEIPPWARDAVMVGTEIGLVNGTASGYLLPNEPMTRAEAAAFLNRFITYMQKDLKTEYRDRILNFR